MSGGLAPVDMQNLTGHERGTFKIQNAVNDGDCPTSCVTGVI
jgi:hypothetical protein